MYLCMIQEPTRENLLQLTTGWKDWANRDSAGGAGARRRRAQKKGTFSQAQAFPGAPGRFSHGVILVAPGGDPLERSSHEGGHRWEGHLCNSSFLNPRAGWIAHTAAAPLCRCLGFRAAPRSRAGFPLLPARGRAPLRAHPRSYRRPWGCTRWGSRWWYS